MLNRLAIATINVTIAVTKLVTALVYRPRHAHTPKHVHQPRHAQTSIAHDWRAAGQP